MSKKELSLIIPEKTAEILLEYLNDYLDDKNSKNE